MEGIWGDEVPELMLLEPPRWGVNSAPRMEICQKEKKTKNR